MVVCANPRYFLKHQTKLWLVQERLFVGKYGRCNCDALCLQIASLQAFQCFVFCVLGNSQIRVHMTSHFAQPFQSTFKLCSRAIRYSFKIVFYKGWETGAVGNNMLNYTFIETILDRISKSCVPRKIGKFELVIGVTISLYRAEPV